MQRICCPHVATVEPLRVPPYMIKLFLNLRLFILVVSVKVRAEGAPDLPLPGGFNTHQF